MADKTANPALPERCVVPHYNDPIRIVPLHVPDELTRNLPHAGVAATPKLTYRGGLLMTGVKVFTVFWGSAWVHTQAGLAKQVNDFFTAILTSSLIGTASVATPAPGKSISDTAIRTMLQHNVAANSAFPQPDGNTLYFVYTPPGVAANSAFPQPDANTLYFVYTPPGSAIVQGGGRSCQAFCGYHDTIGGQLFYAAMPYPNCQGCTGGLSVEDALTSTSSHELCEAITDAVPGQGWYDDANGEIGDICAWKTKKIGQWTVQLEWSNEKGMCA